MTLLKAALCSLGEEYMNEFGQINKLFSEENKVPRILFEARKVAGSATYKQSKMKLCPF